TAAASVIRFMTFPLWLITAAARRRRRRIAGGLEPDDRPVGLTAAVADFRREIDVAVGTDLDVAETHAELAQELLAAQRLPLVVERHALDVLATQGADDQAVLPLRKFVAGVERHGGRADLRRPEDHGILHAVAMERMVRDQRARVVAAERNQRPAVIGAGLQDVHLVAALWSDLHLPELTRHRVEAQAIAVAMAVREDLGFRACAADERIVGRRRAVVFQAQDFADVIVEALRADADAVVVLRAAAEAVAIA